MKQGYKKLYHVWKFINLWNDPLHVFLFFQTQKKKYNSIKVLSDFSSVFYSVEQRMSVSW